MIRPVTPPDVFTFWEGPGREALAPMLAEWRTGWPGFSVIGDTDVIPCLARDHPRLAPLYRRLTIPAARSDIARLAWLWAHGGAYVDAHAGLHDPDGFRRVLDSLPEGGVALIDKNPKTRPPGNSPTALWPLNGAIFARRGAPFLGAALAAITEGLEAYDRAPALTASIWEISGPGLFITLLRDPDNRCAVIPRWRDEVRMLKATEAPVRFYAHKGYRDPARHWSTREQTEPLLAPAPEA